MYGSFLLFCWTASRKKGWNGEINMVVIGVLLGGAAGAYLRYAFSLWFRGIAGTMFVNGIGSLVLGVFAAFATKRGMNISPTLTVGFCGAFTTFSTFSLEVIQLLENKRLTHALIYIIASVLGSIVMFSFGYIMI